jgi:hypothetical protein
MSEIKYLLDENVDPRLPGIFMINPYMTMGEMSEELALIQAASDPEEYVNRIVYLPLSY